MSLASNLSCSLYADSWAIPLFLFEIVIAKLAVHYSCLPQGKRCVAEFNQSSLVFPEKLPFFHVAAVRLGVWSFMKIAYFDTVFSVELVMQYKNVSEMSIIWFLQTLAWIMLHACSILLYCMLFKFISIFIIEFQRIATVTLLSLFFSSPKRFDWALYEVLVPKVDIVLLRWSSRTSWQSLIVQPTTFQSLRPAWLAVWGSNLGASLLCLPLLRNSTFPATRMRSVWSN